MPRFIDESKTSEDLENVEVADNRRMQRPVIKISIKDPLKTVRRLWSYVYKEKYKLFFAVSIMMFNVYLGILAPFLMGKIVDEYILTKDLIGLKNNILLLGAIYFASSFIRWLRSYIMVAVAQNSILRIRKDLFSQIQKLSINYFDTHSHGNLISRITNDVGSISKTLSGSITQFISSGLTIAGVLFTMMRMNWKLALITIFSTPLILLATIPIASISKAAFTARLKSLGKVNGMVEETVSGQKIVKTFVKEEDNFQEFSRLNEELRENAIRANIYSGLLAPINSLISHVRYAVIATVGGYMVLKNISSLGEIVTFINYSKQFSRPINELAKLYNSIQLAIAGAERIFEIIDINQEYIDSDEAEDEIQIKGKVEFRDVNFEYIKNTPILQDINLTITPGEKIALVGPTGAGKTTIANLLMRFYDSSSGSLLIDDNDITNLKKYSLRKKIGIVLQDSYLFTGTIMDNIRYGKLTATDEEVYNAARLAKAHNFIRKLPNGYNTYVKDEGKNFSAGQKQLISIARTILADTDMLILDEATSSVDTRTELLIQNAMINLMKNRTTFVIAHRLSTIRDADRIVVIDNGQIVEMGNHYELIEKQGFYHNLYTLQFKGHEI